MIDQSLNVVVVDIDIGARLDDEEVHPDDDGRIMFPP
jgi:hypothetical protein